MRLIELRSEWLETRIILQDTVYQGKELLTRKVEESGLYEFSRKISTCISRLQETSENLDKTNEEISLLIEKSDEAKYMQQLENDFSLMDQADDCCFSLIALEKQLSDRKRHSEELSRKAENDKQRKNIEAQLQILVENNKILLHLQQQQLNKTKQVNFSQPTVSKISNPCNNERKQQTKIDSVPATVDIMQQPKPVREMEELQADIPKMNKSDEVNVRATGQGKLKKRKIKKHGEKSNSVKEKQAVKRKHKKPMERKKEFARGLYIRHRRKRTMPNYISKMQHKRKQRGCYKRKRSGSNNSNSIKDLKLRRELNFWMNFTQMDQPAERKQSTVGRTFKWMRRATRPGRETSTTNDDAEGKNKAKPTKLQLSHCTNGNAEQFN